MMIFLFAVVSVVFLRRLLVTTGLISAAGVDEAGLCSFTSSWFWIKLTFQVSIFWTAVSFCVKVALHSL